MRKSSFTIRTNSFLDSKVANDFVQQIGFTPCSRVIFVKSPSLFGWLNISSPNMAFWIHKIIIVTPQKDSSSPSPGQTANFPGTVVASPKKTGHQEGHSNVRMHGK